MVKLNSLACFIYSYIEEKENIGTNDTKLKQCTENAEYANFKAIKTIDTNENKENWVELAFCLMFIFFFNFI